MNMTIEQKMQYIRKALEMGADVDVKFYDAGDKQAALQVAKELSDFIHVPYEQKSYDGSNWLRINSADWSLKTAVYYDNQYEEVSV